MKNKIRELKYKLGIWLITDKKFYASSMTISKLTNEMRCVHCGKNPYFKDKIMKSLNKMKIKNYHRLVFIDKNGYPIESIIKNNFKTFLRKLILTRKIVTYKTWLKNGGFEIDFNNLQANNSN